MLPHHFTKTLLFHFKKVLSFKENYFCLKLLGISHFLGEIFFFLGGGLLRGISYPLYLFFFSLRLRPTLCLKPPHEQYKYSLKSRAQLVQQLLFTYKKKFSGGYHFFFFFEGVRIYQPHKNCLKPLYDQYVYSLESSAHSVQQLPNS